VAVAATGVRPALSGPAAIWILLVLGAGAAALFVPAFADPSNLANVARQSAVLGLIALGQTFVVAAGLIDLSVGTTAGLVVVLASALMAGDPASMAWVTLAMLALGAGIGAANGLLLIALRLHPLILTFGMMSVLQGAIFTFTDRSVGRPAPQLSALANGSIWGVPASLLLLLAVAAVLHVVLVRARFGHHLLAAGGAPEAARRAGVNLTRIHLAVFVLSGLCAAAGGLVLAGRLGTGFPLAGAGLELDSIVAVVLGGTALAGGRASVVGTLGGVLALAVLSNVLNLMGVSAFVQTFVKGCVVVAAVVAAQMRRGRAG
jgi:ribose/xylose/arabinose/galactoside ABC-type transport system permease subunit